MNQEAYNMIHSKQLPSDVEIRQKLKPFLHNDLIGVIIKDMKYTIVINLNKISHMVQKMDVCEMDNTIYKIKFNDDNVNIHIVISTYGISPPETIKEYTWSYQEAFDKCMFRKHPEVSNFNLTKSSTCYHTHYMIYEELFNFFDELIDKYNKNNNLI